MNNFSSGKDSQHKPEKASIYYINAQKFETFEKKLTARHILERAEFTPTDDYKLIRDNGQKEIENLDEEFPIHNEEAFTAVFKGVTPVSEV